MTHPTRFSRREFLIRTATLASVAAISSAFAACAPAGAPATGGSQSAPAQAAITLTMWKGPHKAAGDETKLCAQPTLDLFEKANPDIKVDFSEVPWGQYNEKFTAAFAANTGPDVSYQTESFPRFVDAGQILQLDDLISSTSFDKSFYYPRMWETCTYNGKIFALPWITGGSNLFWNKDLFEKAGLDPEKAPDTTEEFLDAAKKITALGDDTYGFASDPTDIHENGQWPRRFGGDWFNQEVTKCTIDSPEAMAGLQFLDDLYHKDKVAMPGEVTGQEPHSYGYFRDGKVGMITGQNVLANSIRKEKPDFKLGLARMAKGPAAEPAGRACYGGVGMLAIAQKTTHPTEAWKLVSALSTPELLKSWIGCLGFMSVSPKVNYYADDPLLTLAQSTLEYTFFWPYRSWVFKFWDIEGTAISSFLLGQSPIEKAVQDMVVQINDMIKAG
ncbi:sugar ABC transporter substrate-binding protein [soil metagenome]